MRVGGGGKVIFTVLLAFQIRLCGLSNSVIGKRRNSKNLEVSSCEVFHLLGRNLIGRTEKNHEKGQ